MKPPKTIKLRDFLAILRKHNIVLRPGTKHMILCAPDGTKYPIPYRSGHDDVERCYVNGARRAFRLTRQDGITDEDFYGAV